MSSSYYRYIAAAVAATAAVATASIGHHHHDYDHNHNRNHDVVVPSNKNPNTSTNSFPMTRASHSDSDALPLPFLRVTAPDGSLIQVEPLGGNALRVRVRPDGKEIDDTLPGALSEPLPASQWANFKPSDVTVGVSDDPQEMMAAKEKKNGQTTEGR